MMLHPMPYIESMSLYALAKVSIPPGMRAVSLSQNESLRQPSPMVWDAVSTALRDSHLYPDTEWTDLRHELAKLHEIDFESIICGNGSLELIACIAQTYLGPGIACLAPENAYPFFRTATIMTGARFDTAPEENLTVSVDALLSSVTPETRVVFLANPGNPTGTRLDKKEIVRLREGLNDDILLVIDQAYEEFAEHLGERLWEFCDLGNTVILRTYSKAYGLAGFRVGWGLFPERIGMQIRKTLNPNNVSTASQAAAVAAVKDQEYMRENCEITAQARDRFVASMSEAKIDARPTFTNFVLLNFESRAVADHLNNRLAQEGVFLRSQAGAGLPASLRVTMSNHSDMEYASEVIKNAYWTAKR